MKQLQETRHQAISDKQCETHNCARKPARLKTLKYPYKISIPYLNAHAAYQVA